MCIGSYTGANENKCNTDKQHSVCLMICFVIVMTWSDFPSVMFRFGLCAGDRAQINHSEENDFKTYWMSQFWNKMRFMTVLQM